MIVGFTGTRMGMSAHQKEYFRALLAFICPTEFHHGDCVGADSDAHIIVREEYPDCYIVAHPGFLDKRTANYLRAFTKADEVRPQFSFLVRNRHIVDESSILIAAPLYDHEILRSGTWATIRYGLRQAKKVTVLKRCSHGKGTV